MVKELHEGGTSFCELEFRDQRGNVCECNEKNELNKATTAIGPKGK